MKKELPCKNCREKVKQIYDETKSSHDFFLSPSEQYEFWTDFAMRICRVFIN